MVKPIRVFLASPDDVTEERNRVQRIIEQLSRSRTSKDHDLIIELLRWETHTRPDMGPSVVLQQLKADSWDIFIGILWLKFGTPTNTNPQSPFLSGTEEEFQAAYTRWRESHTGWPRIMFYRCKRPPVDMDALDTKQFENVRAFFHNFSADGLHPGFHRSYSAIEEFEDMLHEHLTDVLFEYKDYHKAQSEPRNKAPDGQHEATETAAPDVTDIAWPERDQSAIDYFISLYSDERREFLTNDTILRWLQRWQLIHRVDGNHYFTRAGALLFGPQDQHSVQTDVYISYHNKDSQFIRLEGLCLMDLAQKLLRELAPLWERTWEEPDKRDESGKPLKFSVYPETAIVEASVNLIIHRDYSSTEKAYVDIYDDKIVFANPGSSQHPVEALLADDELERQPYARNHLIINTFSRTGLNQTQRQGIRRIRDSLQANQSQGPSAGLALKILSSEENNTFKLTVFAAKPPETSVSQIGTIINTGGGPYIAAGINIGGGDFVVRDHTVSRDDIVEGHKISNLFYDSVSSRNQRHHAALRQMVRKYWIDGILKRPLYHEVRIRINLETHPSPMKHPWDMDLQRPNLPNKRLTSDTPIIEIFDQMNQNLLLLGEPGSGKTTMLLELADVLLTRAEYDPTQPTPVIFALSAWTTGQQSLEKWLITELREKYNLPLKLAQGWITNDELLPLLDALDEVQPNARQACVTAINEFRKEHLTALVVSSRRLEYENITTELQFQGAVVLQPLTETQVNHYLYQIGADPEFIEWLKEQDSVRSLLTSPLFLSILTMSVGRTDRHLMDGERKSAQLLFDTYIRTMLIHRSLAHRSAPEQMIHWLRQLAITMLERNQSIFVVKRGLSGWYQQLISWGIGNTPLNLTQFLESATEHIFLRRVGEGYIFVHRLLMEHFANLTDEDIKRVTAELDKADRP